jgi:phosphatidylglycerophosphatase A
MFRAFILASASLCYLSHIPYRLVPHEKWKGGGLLGSLAGWAILWVMPPGGWPAWAALGTAAAFSIWASHWAEKFYGAHDDPRIIIDEVAGVWTAALFLPRAAAPMVLGLVFFRVFDVLKGPWGRAAARLPGGWGVVADDLLAGALAYLCVRLAGMVMPFPPI